MRQRTRIILNVLSNYGAFLIYGIVNVIVVGYVVRRIGTDAFGVVALVMSLIIITEFVGRGICQAVTKHVAAGMSKGDFDSVNRFVNTSLVWLGFCGLLGAAMCAGLAMCIDTIARIPNALIPEARLAMWLMGLRVLLCFPLNAFQSILWAHQRYDLGNIAKSVTLILRLVLVFVYFEFVSAGVVELIVITIITLLIERLLWIFFCLRITKNLKLGYSFVSMSTGAVLSSFGGLLLIIHAANMVGYEAVKWVVGYELSVTDVGGYSLVATLAAFAATMIRSSATVLMPVASKYNALEQHEANAQLALLSTKYAMIVAGGLCVMPLFLLETFLTLWVGDTYSTAYIAQIALAGSILLVGQWFIATSTSVLQMLTGIGKVKFPAMVTGGWAVGGLGCLWAYLRWFDGSLVGGVMCICLARLIGSVVHLFYGMRILGVEHGIFIEQAILRPAYGGIIACLSVWAYRQWVNVHSIPEFLLACVIFGSVYLFATWFIVLSSVERSEIVEKLTLIMGKIRTV